MMNLKRSKDGPLWLPKNFTGVDYIWPNAPKVPAYLIDFDGHEQVIPATWAIKLAISVEELL